MAKENTSINKKKDLNVQQRVYVLQMMTGANERGSRKTTYQSSTTVSLVEPVPEMEFTTGVSAGQITSLQARKTDCYVQNFNQKAQHILK